MLRLLPNCCIVEKLWLQYCLHGGKCVAEYACFSTRVGQQLLRFLNCLSMDTGIAKKKKKKKGASTILLKLFKTFKHAFQLVSLMLYHISVLANSGCKWAVENSFVLQLPSLELSTLYKQMGHSYRITIPGAGSKMFSTSILKYSLSFLGLQLYS